MKIGCESHENGDQINSEKHPWLKSVSVAPLKAIVMESTLVGIRGGAL